MSVNSNAHQGHLRNFSPAVRHQLFFPLKHVFTSLIFSVSFLAEQEQRKTETKTKMVDDFMVCVDRIIASACFQSVNNNEGVVERAERGEVAVNFSVSLKKTGEGACCSKKQGSEMVECRICQEEDLENELEAPCACNGTLKFAHRKCIQRWCNKKGDITCEICNQVYTPDYSLPPISNVDGIAIDIRQALGAQIDLHGPHFLALTAAEHQLLQSEYEEYAVANNSGMACFRSVALILMLVLLFHHALIFASDARIVHETTDFFNVSTVCCSRIYNLCKSYQIDVTALFHGLK
ncbi:hypothetical protein Syun_005891 [Stephania yunnanensis]|uniref:RING-CH-type domain-containing protein n=1 Tax=Stephania yunnanensis TaxID=152371 RepID=A0AAP0PY35_9MAGN